MKQIILKYQLPFHHEGFIIHKIPEGYKILHLGIQGQTGYIWVIVDSEQEKTETLIIRCYDTGKSFHTDFPGQTEHLGTLLYLSGDYVLHYFKIN